MSTPTYIIWVEGTFYHCSTFDYAKSVYQQARSEGKNAVIYQAMDI